MGSCCYYSQAFLIYVIIFEYLSVKCNLQIFFCKMVNIRVIIKLLFLWYEKKSAVTLFYRLIMFR